jgi:hypothetical protein
MAMARNDIQHAMLKAGDTNESHQPEFAYWVRLVMGHFLEAADALQQWRSCSSEVRAFLRALPPKGQSALKEVGATLSKVGKPAVSHARNHTFHYPTPSEKYESDAELITVLEANKGEDVKVERVEGHPNMARFVFADDLALLIAMGKHSTEDEGFRTQSVDLRNGAAAFVNFVGVALEKHLVD